MCEVDNLASHAFVSKVADGPLRTIFSSPTDAPRHGSETAAALPTARHRRCCRSGFRNRRRLWSESAATVTTSTRSSGSIVHRNCWRWQNVQPFCRPSAVVGECGCYELLPRVSRPPFRLAVLTQWSSLGRFAASRMSRRLSPRRTECSGAMGRFASSSTGDRPIPRWLGGRTVSPPFGHAARVAAISIGKRMISCDRRGSG